MRSTASHIGASVVVVLLVFVGVSSLPARLENTHLVAEEDIHLVKRRAHGQLRTTLPPTVQNISKSCNKSDDNSTLCSTTGIGGKVKNIIESNISTIYRALIVLGSISAIILVYISFRYFR